MTEMQSIILNKIKEIQEQKDSEHIVPNYACYVQITNSIIGDVQKSLNELCRNKVITYHQLLNDKAFSINGER